MNDDTSFETHRQQETKDFILQLRRLIAEKDAEIERLKTLLTHAADALTYTRSCWGWLKETSSINELIAELRKAAE